MNYIFFIMFYISFWLNFAHFSIFSCHNIALYMNAFRKIQSKLKNINNPIFIRWIAITWHIHSNNHRKRKNNCSHFASLMKVQSLCKNISPVHHHSFAQLFKTGSQAWYCHSQSSLMLSLDLHFVFNEATAENPISQWQVMAKNLWMGYPSLQQAIWDVNLRLRVELEMSAQQASCYPDSWNQ